MLIWVDTFARLKCVTASFCGCCGGGASVTPWALTSQVAWFKPASSLMALLWLDYYSRWCYLTTTTLTPYLWDRWLFFIGWGTGFSCPLGIANFVIGQSWSFDETRYFFFLYSWHSQCLKILPHRVRFYNLFACGKGYVDVEILILDYLNYYSTLRVKQDIALRIFHPIFYLMMTESLPLSDRQKKRWFAIGERRLGSIKSIRYLFLNLAMQLNAIG